MKDRMSKYQFNQVLSRTGFSRSNGANSDQKKEYIKAVFDDTMDRWGDGRENITKQELDERIQFLRKNRRDILSDQDIDRLAQKIKPKL